MAEGTSASDLLGLMLRRWWVLLLGIVVGLGLSLLALQVVPPTYTATATQLIKGVPGSGTGAPYLAAQFAVARAKSYPAFIHSSDVLDNVRSDMGAEFTDARLRDQLSASNPTDTPLVQVTATGSTAEEAQDLANSASRHLARFITQIETVSGTTPVIVETAVQAGLPSSPSFPQPTLFVALGLTGGFAAGVVAVVAWGAFAGRARRAIIPGSAEEVGEPEGDGPQPAEPAAANEPEAEADPADGDETAGVEQEGAGDPVPEEAEYPANAPTS